MRFVHQSAGELLAALIADEAGEVKEHAAVIEALPHKQANSQTFTSPNVLD